MKGTLEKVNWRIEILEAQGYEQEAQVYKALGNALRDFQEQPLTAHVFLYQIVEHLVETVGLDGEDVDLPLIDRLTAPLPLSTEELVNKLLDKDFTNLGELFVQILRDSEWIDDYYEDDEDEEEEVDEYEYDEEE